MNNNKKTKRDSELEQVQIDNEREIDKYNKINYIFEMSHGYIIYSCDLLIKTVKIIINVSGIYLLWILFHYIASHMYVNFCVPKDLIGFLISPLLTSTPHCQGLRWIVYNGGNVINNMWVVLGTWLCSTLFRFSKDINMENI